MIADNHNIGQRSPREALPELAKALTLEAFPRSSAYDPTWMLENLMGPCALWLIESLCQVMDLRPGLRVLDLGCGKALSSIFLAKEFGVEMWATDLWIAATDNLARIQAAGVDRRVFPIHAEARALPFAHGFFDAIVSADAYHYFGTDDLYLGYLARFLKTGGSLGIVVPGIQQEFVDSLPSHLTPFWESEFWSFHSPTWWRAHWERTVPMRVETADMIPDGWAHWFHWLEVAGKFGYPTSDREAEMVRVDAGRTLGFSRVVAHRIS
jgi:SAM-dependent methyltransferase